jgi:Domain of unknown function (DUF6321)
MKTIKQIREEYDRISLDQVHNVPDELMLEGRESVVKSAGKAVPSPANMPAMLLFRRVAYRSYPGKQTVALYYSKLVNKYLSVPFGPDGNLNLSESVIHDTLDEGKITKAIVGGLKAIPSGALKGAAWGNVAHLPGMAVGATIGGAVSAYKGAKKAYNKAKEQENMEEDWQKINRRDKTDGLSPEAVRAYRNENPRSNLQTAVTEKNPTGRRASRRKSFCSRMGGMKKRLTSAKNARDPDSPINKALRRWNCEESFKEKLAEKRQLREEQLDENPVALARMAIPAIAKYGKKIPGAAAVGDMVVSGGKKLLSKIKTPKTPKPKKAPATPKSGTGAAADAASAAAGAAAGAAATKASETSDKDSGSAFTPHKADLITAKTQPKMSSSYENAYRQRVMSGQANENKISDIQNMINEGNEFMDLSINGRTITLNNSMAKKIIRVYESVNTKNKKIVESMLNEDLDSFKKLLNFSIKA